MREETKNTNPSEPQHMRLSGDGQAPRGGFLPPETLVAFYFGTGKISPRIAQMQGTINFF